MFKLWRRQRNPGMEQARQGVLYARGLINHVSLKEAILVLEEHGECTDEFWVAYKRLVCSHMDKVFLG